MRYANTAGAERVVSALSTDEIDLSLSHISRVPPLRRALMKSAAGDSVVLQFVGVRYERTPREPFREPAGSEASAKKLPRLR